MKRGNTRKQILDVAKFLQENNIQFSFKATLSYDLIDGVEHVVRVDGRIMKWCVVDYYDARLWFTGSLGKCKKFIEQHIEEGTYGKEGEYFGN